MKNIIVLNLKVWKIQNVVELGKDGHQKHDDDPSNKILKILAGRSISIKNMKWELGNMEAISFKKDPRVFETLKL